ncbi:hypothetical protein ACH4M4_31960 [Streptomyces sp. NPDC017254]|uniref:hypothetical protein n=1 Tax=unclassified Streptomyces TaxID=2593676 RepID=UPI0037B95A46
MATEIVAASTLRSLAPTALRYFYDFALRRLPAAFATARQDTVTAATAPLAETFADAGGMVQLSREQARGRAGDFEIIEYVLRDQPGGVPGTWGHHFDDYLLHAPITDRYRPHRPLEPRRPHPRRHRGRRPCPRADESG